jgi:hypothetical protein
MTDKLVVWHIELRERELPDGVMECLHWHTSSSRELALKEVERTLIEDHWEYRDDHPWWWFISEVEVDKLYDIGEMIQVDWHGRIIDFTPWNGYNVEYRTHEQDCEICQFSKELLGEWTMHNLQGTKG